jgi:hypothetical protein
MRVILIKEINRNGEGLVELLSLGEYPMIKYGPFESIEKIANCMIPALMSKPSIEVTKLDATIQKTVIVHRGESYGTKKIKEVKG